MSIETSVMERESATTIEIGRVTRDSVELTGPRTVLLDWEQLGLAARQQDPELRAAYAAVLKRGEAKLAEQESSQIERSNTLVVRWGQDSSRVWWHAWVETAQRLHVGKEKNGLTIMLAEEGGSLPQAWMAREEAEAIAARIRKIGWTATVREAVQS